MAQLTPSYSIWAVPKGHLANHLNRELGQLAARFNAPSFLPHVTILGGIDTSDHAQVLSNARTLASQIAPYTIHLDKVSSGSIFYQCVYILCEKTPKTLAPAALAKLLYGIDDSPYMPHLSLLYSNIDQEQREKLANDLQQELFGGGDNSSSALSEVQFDVDSFQVWYTPKDESLESWSLVAEIPLSG